MTDAREIDLFLDTHETFLSLVKGASPELLESRVPACPSWTLRDLTSHVVGMVSDTVSGRYPASRSDLDQWTAQQVNSRKGKSLAELVTEWDGASPIITRAMASGTVPIWPFITGTAIHEQAARVLLGEPGGRDSPGFQYARISLSRQFTSRIRRARLAALNLITADWNEVAGEGTAASSFRASAFELHRALSGRRSIAQMRAYEWEGDSEPYIGLLPLFRPATHDLVESG